MVAAYTVPVQDSFPLPEGLQQVAGGEKRRLQPPEGSPLDRDDLLEQFEKELEENLARAVAPQDLEQEDHKQEEQAQAPQLGKDQEKKPEEEKDAAKKKNEDQKDEDDLWGIVPHRHEELTAAEIRWWDVKDQFWKEKITELQGVEVRNLTFAVPMQSRRSREVVRAVQEVYIRLRTLQLPVLRLHSDRAREFTGVKLVNNGTSCKPVLLATNQQEMGGVSPSWASSRHRQGCNFVQLDWKPTGGLWPCGIRWNNDRGINWPQWASLCRH